MYIFHDESGVFAPSSKPGSFSVVAAYVVSEAQFRAAKKVLLNHKIRNKWPINHEFKRRELGGAEEPYFRFLDELASVGGILVAVGSDVSGNTHLLEYQEDYAKGLLVGIGANGVRDEIAIKNAQDIRKLSSQNFTELACRVRLGWEVLQRATGYFAQSAPGALRRREWHYDYKDKKNNVFDTVFKNTLIPLMQRHALHDALQLIKGANYKHLGDAMVRESSEIKVRPERLLGSIVFLDSGKSEGVQLADLLANGLFGLLNNRFSDRRRAAKLLGKLMVRRQGTLLLPTMNYSDGPSKRAPEIEELMHSMLDVARPLIIHGYPIRTNGRAVV